MPVQQGSGHRSFLAGFDYGDAAAFGTASVTGASTVTVQQTITRSGAGALRTNAASGARARFGMTAGAAALNRSFFRAYVYVVAYPTAPRIILTTMALAGSSTTPQVQLNTDGTLSLQSGNTAGGAGTIHATTPAPVPLATWTCIEIGVNAQDDRSALRVNGADVGGWVAVTAFAAGIGLTLGPSDVIASALDLYWDDVAVDLEDWCGPGKVERVRLASLAHDSGDLTITGGGTLLSTVDEDAYTAAPSDATYVSTAAAGGSGAWFALPALPMGRVRGVLLNARARQAAGSSVTFESRPVADTPAGRRTSPQQLPAGGTWGWARTTFANTAVTQTARDATPYGGLWTTERIARTFFGFSAASAFILDLSLLAVEVDVDDESDLGPPATRTLIEGFETGRKASTDIASGTWAVQSTLKRTGSYALRVNPTTNATSVYTFTSRPTISVTATPDVFVRAYVYVTAMPTTNPTYLMGVGGVVGLALFPNGSIQFRGGAGDADASAAPTYGAASAAGVIPTGAWTLVELRVVRSSSTADSNTYECRVNGVTVLLETNQPQLTTGTAGMFLGGNGTTNAFPYDIAFDDIAVDATDWCGPGRVGVLTPNATTPAGAVLGDSGPTTGLPLHEMVDEVPPDDDSTYFNLGVTNSAAIFYEAGFTDPDAAALVVRGISVAEEAKSTGAGTAAWTRRPVVSGEADQGTLATTSAITNYSSKFAIGQVSPFRGAWTPDLLAALSYRMQPADTADNLRLTQLLVQYDYAIADAVPDAEIALGMSLALSMTTAPALAAGISAPLEASPGFAMTPGMGAGLSLLTPLPLSLPLTALTAVALSVSAPLDATLALAADLAATLQIAAPLLVDVALTPALLNSLGVAMPLPLSGTLSPDLATALSVAAPLEVQLVLVAFAMPTVADGTPLLPGSPSTIMLIGRLRHTTLAAQEARTTDLIGRPHRSDLTGEPS